MNEWNGNGSNGETERPAPPCPVCQAEMTLTTEKRDDGSEHQVWTCPRSAKHWPPPPPALDARWWEGILPP